MDTTQKVATFVLSKFQGKKVDVSIKGDGSCVTNIDIEAESMAKELLLSQFPEDGFLGEEHDEHYGVSEYRWVVDPIDGTTSFIRGVPLFGTQIGLEYQGEPIAGNIVMPAMKESIWAPTGSDPSGPDPRGSGTGSIENALICTTSIDYYKQTNSLYVFDALMQSGASIRGWSDCYAYMLLCTGRIDAVVEPLLHPWDIVPWIPIFKETGIKYSPIAEGYLASNQKLHDSLYDVLNANITN